MTWNVGLIDSQTEDTCYLLDDVAQVAVAVAADFVAADFAAAAG